jgi:DNA-directed RNA polymerase specialized sigma subunit
MVYHDLPTIDQRVMELAYGLHGRKPIGTGDIAKRLGVTPGRVSQRLSSIQEKLDVARDLW